MISILGTGRMGKALGLRLADLGHSVIFGTREPDRADIQDIIATSNHHLPLPIWKPLAKLIILSWQLLTQP